MMSAVCKLAAVFVATVMILGAGAALIALPLHQPPKTLAERYPGYDPSVREGRAEFVERLKASGVVGSYQRSGGVVTVDVRLAFIACDFDDKRTFASVFFGWGLDADPGTRRVELRDPATHKSLGCYSPELGLTWY